MDDDPDDDLTEIRAAASAAELHRLLMRGRVGGRSTRHREAVELFVHHHREDPADAVDTAVLLCTESRWHPPSRRCCAGPRDACSAASGRPSTGCATGQRRWTPGAARPFSQAPSTRRTH